MRVVAFQNQKGGVGKSTLSLLVAEQLAQSGRKVIFLDNDLFENDQFNEGSIQNGSLRIRMH